MAYAVRQQSAERFTSIGAVLLIHTVLALVIVNQFTPGLIPRLVPPRFIPTFEVKSPPPTPAEPPQDQPKKAEQTTIVAPLPTDDLHPVDTQMAVDPIPLDPATFEQTTAIGLPSGSGMQKPAFIPKSPAPANSPSGWATSEDYPSASLKLDERGTTTFRVSVGSDGLVKACEIIRSSGHKRLDEATCNLVTHRARFEPATDKNGEKVVGTYSNSVRWVLPN
jgi:protein TonB